MNPLAFLDADDADDDSNFAIDEDDDDDDGDEVMVELVSDSGFGLTLSSVGPGEGVFAGALKPGGVAERVFGERGLAIEDGLRFKMVGSVDVMDDEKREVVAQMRAANGSMVVVFIRDRMGYGRLYRSGVANVPPPRPRAPRPRAPRPRADEVTVRLVNQGRGYGLTLFSEGSGKGVFAGAAKMLGVAEEAFGEMGVQIGDGLRFKMVGTTNVLNAAKADCVRAMRRAEHEVTVTFLKDPAGCESKRREPGGTGNRVPRVEPGSA